MQGVEGKMKNERLCEDCDTKKHLFVLLTAANLVTSLVECAQVSVVFFFMLHKYIYVLLYKYFVFVSLRQSNCNKVFDENHG